MRRARMLAGQLDVEGNEYTPPPPKPVVRLVATKATWGRLVKQDRTCDHCFRDQHEAHLHGEPIGVRRTARYRRTLPGDKPELLCHAHADLRRKLDGLPVLDHNRNGTRA